MSDPSRYSFVTNWEIPSSQAKVWDLLMAAEDWPQWWRGVERVELLQPGINSLGLGAVRRYRWRSRLPYSLTFVMKTTLVEPHSRIEGHATGELEGFGRWQLRQVHDVTHVRYDWMVVTNKGWMRWLAPIARPLFEWNHDVIMKWGRDGLIKKVSQPD
jgi:uncharacterized protein YndB with AHSA1/START domain